MSHNKEKLEKKVEFEQIKYNEMVEIKKSLEEEIRSFEGKVKDAHVAEDKINQLLNAEKFKVEDLNIKLNKAAE